MIHFFIGTKAQFIKMMPVMIELKRRALAFRYVDSGQHARLTRMLRDSLGLPAPDLYLSRRTMDVSSITEGVAWLGRLAWLCAARRRWLREHVFAGGGICLIHGDTVSTLVGLVMARSAGLEVGHVEAGLRSFCLWDPFPEELIRVFCMKRVGLLFAPSDEAESNLRNMAVRGRTFNSGANTIVDALRLLGGADPTISLPAEPFVLATCHRMETIRRRDRLARVVGLLNRFSSRIRVVFVKHEATARYLRRFGLTEELAEGVDVLGMQDYVNFAALLRAAKAVLTDGGSIQEECFHLSKPCLILRRRTERPDGLGRNAVLWGFDEAVAAQFLADVDKLGSAGQLDRPSPSAKIVDVLIAEGFAEP